VPSPGEVAFDPVIHAPARLKLMMILARLPVATFNDMARDADLTAGNLAAHLKALEAAGYIESARGLVDLKPRMRYAMTPQGKDALKAYCVALRAAVSGIEDLVG
jgi:DNA-binding MarR family transcriptional regulator